MTEDLNIRKARSVYRKLNEAVEKNGWKCKTNDDKLALAYGIKTAVGLTEFVAYIDAERQLVCVGTFPLMTFDASRLRDGALSVCAANLMLADGNFDLRMKSGELSFRQAVAFRESTNLSVEAITYMLDYALYAVNAFIDKFKLVNEGKLSGADFAEACKDIK